MPDRTVTVRLSAQIASYQASMMKATASTRAFSGQVLKSAGQNRQAFTAIGLGAVTMGAALAGSLGMAAKAAMDFESSFAGVRKTVDATEPEFAALSAGMRELATTIPVNVNELNRIGEAAGQLGIQTENILGFTRVMADLGATTNLTSDQAATALARLANIMQTPQTQFDRLGSSIVHLGNNLETTEAEITEFGLRIAGAGKIAGLTESDILAIGGAMSSVGVQAERGGTAVQKVLIGITDAVNSGSDKLEVFARTAGMSAEQFAADWRGDPIKAFVAFVEGLGKAGQDGVSVLRELGLADQRLIQSFLSLAGAGDKLRTSVALGTQAWEENNALTEEAGKRYETTASQVQIAKNKLNDAAISFGQLLLPAIAATVGALGDLAAFVGDLPGPVKTAVVAFAGLSGALLLLGGTTLLLLPRIALVKAEFAKAGIQAGVMRGSVSLLGRALANPFGLALVAATFGLGLFAQRKAEARQIVEEFTAAIEADSGALGANTRITAANLLQKEGLLRAAENLGIGVDTLTDAVLGDADALKEVTLKLREAEGGTAELVFGLLRLNEKLGEGQEAARLKADAIGEDADATAGAAGATGDYAGALGDLQGEMDETASAADDLNTALDLLTGGTLDAEKAGIAWRDAIRGLHDTVKNGKPTLEGYSEDADRNREAINRAIDAAIDHGAAVAEQTGSVEKGAKAVQRHMRELITQASQAGISEGAIRAYIRQLNLTPKQIKTIIEATGIAEAQAAIDNLIRYNSGRVIGVRIQGMGGGRLQHAGGLVGTSGAQRLHGGGMAGLRSNEVPTILERGEVVFTAAQFAGLRSILGTGAGPAAGPTTTYNTTVNAHAVDLDEKGLVRWLRRAEMLHG